MARHLLVTSASRNTPRERAAGNSFSRQEFVEVKTLGLKRHSCTPPFVVLVERSKGNEKSCLPKLTDKVYTLKSIARNGSYAKRLEKANIHTVGDFLKVLNKDRNKLHQTVLLEQNLMTSLLQRTCLIQHRRLL